MKRRVLYLPVEVKPRELYGKLFLAAKAAERGWQVQIGRDREVRKAMLHGPHGAMIEVNIPEPKAEELRGYRALGHQIANLCEESIVYYGGHDYCQRKIGRTALGYADILLVVGARNEDDLRRYRPESGDKIIVTGNPRFDTLMPPLRTFFAAEAEPIRKRYGRFLLVNTNFGPVNHAKRSSAEILAGLEKMRLVEDAAHGDMLRRWHAYKRAHLEALKPVLAEITRSRRYDNVVVRPHPTESHETWHRWADPLGIKVHFEGSANVWMLAAEAMLHTGCTTAIEAALLDLPVTSFVPEPGHEMLNQADEISDPVATAADFLAAAERQPQASSGTDPRLAAQRAKVARIVANTNPPMSADRILDALERLDVPEVPALARRDSPLSAAWHAVHALTRARGSYAYRKFDSLTQGEIDEPLRHWVRGGVLQRMPDRRRQADGTWIFS